MQKKKTAAKKLQPFFIFLFFFRLFLKVDIETHQHWRQKQKICEHRHKQRYVNQKSQGYRSAELRETENHKTRQKNYRRVNDTYARFPQRSDNRFRRVVIRSVKFVPEFGKQVDSVVNRNSESDVKH